MITAHQHKQPQKRYRVYFKHDPVNTWQLIATYSHETARWIFATNNDMEKPDSSIVSVLLYY